MKPVTSLFSGSTSPASDGCGRGGGAEAGNRVDQFADTEVLERGTEEHRGQIAIAIGFQIEFGIADLGQFNLFGDICRQFDIGFALAEEFAAVAFGPADFAGSEIEHALEQPAQPDRPTLRADIQRQRIGHFIERFEW